MGDKKPPAKAKDSPAEVARAAGCTRQLAHRLLQRGMTRSEIIARVAEQKTRKAELLEFPATAVPVTNGHAATDGMLSYAGAQASKENWLAALRKLEYQKKCGELIPTSYIRRWAMTFLVEGRDILLQGPSELADTLAAESNPRVVEEILQAWVGRVMEHFFRLESLWGGGEPLDESVLQERYSAARLAVVKPR